MNASVSSAPPCLDPADPPAVEVLNPHGRAPLLLVCDHASKAVPRRLNNLGLGPEELSQHISWDSGAAEVTIPNRSTGAWQKLLVGSDSRLPTIHDDAAYAKRGPGKHGDHRPPGGETAGAGTTREQKRSTPLSVLSAVFSSAGGFPWSVRLRTPLECQGRRRGRGFTDGSTGGSHLGHRASRGN